MRPQQPQKSKNKLDCSIAHTALSGDPEGRRISRARWALEADAEQSGAQLSSPALSAATQRDGRCDL